MGNVKAATIAYTTINGGLKNFGNTLVDGGSVGEAVLQGTKGSLVGAATGFGMA